MFREEERIRAGWRGDGSSGRGGFDFSGTRVCVCVGT